MQVISTPVSVTRANAWGRDVTLLKHQEVIEPADVGRARRHYLGYQHRDYTFGRSDVGRIITVYVAPGYTSWEFAITETVPEALARNSVH